MDNNNTDCDNELCYDSNLSFSGLLASYVAYIYENHAVPRCDSTRESIYSSESISVLSDRTYIFDINSNETSIETLNSSIKTSFNADSSEIPSLHSDVTDC